MSGGQHGPGRWPVSALEPAGFVARPGGAALAYYDLGGEGPPLVLVHATGFCAAVWLPFVAAVRDRFHCVALDQRAHGASAAPGGWDFSWAGLGDDLLALVAAVGLERPVAMGHSSGGAASLLAEETEPGTFAGIYCFEPIVFPGEVPLEPNVEGNPLAVGALRRRSHFSGREVALTHFSSRPPLDRLDSAVLAAYVDNGFEADPAGGIRLRCRPEHEAQMYAHSLSHDAFARLDRVRCPVTLACGARTDAIGPAFLERYAARLGRSEQVVLPGVGHFGPLEDPGLVAGSLARSMAGGIPVGDPPPAYPDSA